MAPGRPDLVRSSAFGHDFWEASLWSWSPVVQQRLRAAVERAATGDLVRYDETMRVRGNHLVTIDITLLPLPTPQGVSTIVCSIIDSPAALRADRHWADRQRTPRAC
jgi:two-component system CheB/CheR fusion protein